MVLMKASRRKMIHCMSKWRLDHGHQNFLVYVVGCGYQSANDTPEFKSNSISLHDHSFSTAPAQPS